jgi:hypothetical protein
MKPKTKLAMAAALGAGLFAGGAHAQDMHRDFDMIASGQAQEGEAVRMRLSIPFGQAEADRRDTRLSFNFQQSDGAGAVRSLDVFSLSLSGDAPPRLESPVLSAAEGDGGFFSRPMNWIWIALGAGVAYWVYDEAQDDDDEAPVGPS